MSGNGAGEQLATTMVVLALVVLVVAVGLAIGPTIADKLQVIVDVTR